MKKLAARGISEGRPQGILHARVPIVKFTDAKSGEGNGNPILALSSASLPALKAPALPL